MQNLSILSEFSISWTNEISDIKSVIFSIFIFNIPKKIHDSQQQKYIKQINCSVVLSVSNVLKEALLNKFCIINNIEESVGNKTVFFRTFLMMKHHQKRINQSFFFLTSFEELTMNRVKKY